MDILRELDKAERIVEALRAQREPDKNKLALMMKPGTPMTYQKFGGQLNRFNEQVHFCVADYVNVAGYILSWREIQPLRVVIVGRGRRARTAYRRFGAMRRDMFTATKSHAAALRIARGRAARYAAARAKSK